MFLNFEETMEVVAPDMKVMTWEVPRTVWILMLLSDNSFDLDCVHVYCDSQ